MCVSDSRRVYPLRVPIALAAFATERPWASADISLSKRNRCEAEKRRVTPGSQRSGSSREAVQSAVPGPAGWQQPPSRKTTLFIRLIFKLPSHFCLYELLLCFGFLMPCISGELLVTVPACTVHTHLHGVSHRTRPIGKSSARKTRAQTCQAPSASPGQRRTVRGKQPDSAITMVTTSWGLFCT